VRSPDRLRHGGPYGGSPAIRLARPVRAWVEVQELVAVHNKPCPIPKIDENGAVGTGSVGDANADVCAGVGRVAVGLSFEVGVKVADISTLLAGLVSTGCFPGRLIGRATFTLLL